MNISDLGVDFIKSWEQFSPIMYLDQGGKPTIGYGHLVEAPKSFGNPITEAEATTLLTSDLFHAEDAVSEVITALEQYQFDALTSLVFNIGVGAFKNSTLLKLVNAGNMEAAIQQFTRWSHVNGIESEGLLARRKAEQLMFSTGVYQNHT